MMTIIRVIIIIKNNNIIIIREYAPFNAFGKTSNGLVFGRHHLREIEAQTKAKCGFKIFFQELQNPEL